jgi:hypothetical protein
LLLLDPAQNGIARKLDPLLPSCHHHSQHFAFVVPVRSKQATGIDQIRSAASNCCRHLQITTLCICSTCTQQG